jgi:hypothetical protein
LARSNAFSTSGVSRHSLRFARARPSSEWLSRSIRGQPVLTPIGLPPRTTAEPSARLKKPGEPRAERPQVLKKVRRASLRSEVFRRLCATKEYRTWCTTSRAVHFHQKTAQSNKRGAENERKCASISLNTSLSMIGKRWTLVYELYGLQEQTPHFDEVVVVTVERNSNEIEACRHIELAVLNFI